MTARVAIAPGVSPSVTRRVFVTGATGYLGSRLIPLLAQRGHELSALVRPGSKDRIEIAARRVVANPLEPDSYVAHVSGADTFVHLIGVPHPSPAKAAGGCLRHSRV